MKQNILKIWGKKLLIFFIGQKVTLEVVTSDQ